MASNVIFLFIINFMIAFIDYTNAVEPAAITEFPEDYEVVFVSAVLRHGDRTAIGLYPGSLNSLDDFRPLRPGQLSIVGRERARQLGIALRRRYDSLLGETYMPHMVKAYSTNKNRTKMTLSTVLSALYPNGQSIPYSCVPVQDDILMLPFIASVKYREELDRVRQSDEVKAKKNQLLPLINSLYNWTGHVYENGTYIARIYHELMAELSAGLEIPHWARNESVVQELEDVVVLEYYIRNFNTKLRRLNGGMLLRNITDTMKGIADGTINDGRKIQLFTGHEDTLAPLLIAMDVFKPHVPAYSSCILVELLRNRDSQYYVGIRYYLGIPPNTTILQIPECSNPCPLQTFVRLIQDVIPTDDDMITVGGDRVLE